MRSLVPLALLALGCAAAPAEPEAPAATPALVLPTRALAPLRASPRPRRPADLPPPISGGTLAASRDGALAVAADPDRDRVWVVDVPGRRLRREVPLADGDEPGRVIEDGAGRFQVVLRGGGALLTLGRDGAVLDRRPVCPAPRGVAHDPRRDVLHVACAGGELVTLPAAGGQALRRLRLDADLRDVLVQDDRILVSRHRRAELLALAADGSGGPDGPVRWRAAPQPLDLEGSPSEPAVASRIIALPLGGVAMLHQRGRTRRPLPLTAGGYKATTPPGCRLVGIVQGAVTYFLPPGPAAASPALPSALVPVDLAASPEGGRLALVAAGLSSANQVLTLPTNLITARQTCVEPQAVPGLAGAATAVAYTGLGELLVQTREPPAIQLPRSGATIALPGASRAHAGHEVFHRGTDSLVACASCHPEAGDDGLVWTFTPSGPRRTQHLRGGLLGTEPFHWDGDMATLPALLADVLGRRMGGGTLDADRAAAVGAWLDGQPALPVTLPPADAVARGERLFRDPQVGCAGCHAGPQLTSNQTVDVGTGAAFQVPRLLGVALRAPYLHEGQAATLRDRFLPSGGGRHGRTAQLRPEDRDDLVAYLESL